MTLNWTSKEYFASLICRDDRANAALEMLVDDLHAAKDRTIRAFLCHSGSEDFLWGLVRLLGSDNARVAGNAAYILGTVAENELGCYRIISMTQACSPRCNTILIDLTNMLAFDDSESMMNAAGTIGTLAESAEGRAWMLKEDCLNLTISHITNLLSSDNLWTSSNAALVLARLTISEEGCLKILNHDKSHTVLAMLIASLGTDEAGKYTSTVALTWCPHVVYCDA
ncbi:hypothetical protein NP493_189g01018 [Ridgeia piscesae]|uniref:Uncharacterized protein n=1 Tax=Ridgeia piscesae TaxID=27915 RepID=A0AAD9P283_RIDPI|nr:hypothetical protein NP493_189g01018 [Ridgeia piscesae]